MVKETDMLLQKRYAEGGRHAPAVIIVFYIKNRAVVFESRRFNIIINGVLIIIDAGIQLRPRFKQGGNEAGMLRFVFLDFFG
jgi:hypothetical protein